MAVAFQGGFVTGEMGAVVLVPSGTGPYQVVKVRLLFGAGTTTQDVTLRIYTDTGETTPGTQVFTADYTLTASDSAFNEIDLTADSVLVPGNFRVAVEFQHDGMPSIARDTDGTIAASRNFIFGIPGGWFQSSLAGVTGDWIIRADVIDTGTGTPDAGPVPDASLVPDAAPLPDANVGGPDAGEECTLNSDCTNGSYCSADGICTFDCRIDTDCNAGQACDPVGRCVDGEEDGGGCGCRVGERGDASGLAVLLLAGLWLARRRRRRE
jgi:MYXO-CTERM domain-containing protein